MNKEQKEVQQAFLDNEKAVLKLLEENYNQALTDINDKLANLLGRADSDLQHVIYQVEYQNALKTQIKAILEQLQNNNFESISEYLTTSYEDGFIGTMYDLQNQGIPLAFPIDQKQVAEAIRHETKLSTNLYTALGKDVNVLQKQIASEISRGISTNKMYADMAKNISNRAGISRNNAMRIARTEGHRIQNKATADAQFKAKEKGADVVKQWDSTLDSRTRKSHRKLDGQIRELEDPFTVGRHKAMRPGDFGIAGEDINCRCALLQRARWALEDDIEVTKYSEDAPVKISDNGTTQYIDISDSKDYEEFKKKYKKVVEPKKTDVVEPEKVKEDNKKVDTTKEMNALRQELIDEGVKSKEVEMLEKPLTDTEIVEKLSGGDMTKGSCASLGLAYVGNKIGLDVTDYRNGKSREFFARKGNLKKIIKVSNANSTIVKVKKEAADTVKVLNELQKGKEYYFIAGKHAAIVRNAENGLEYLEMQSRYKNGWISFEKYGSVYDTLVKRFGCRKTVDKWHGEIYEKEVVFVEVDSFENNEEFKELLSYLNTATDKQKKGASGSVK